MQLKYAERIGALGTALPYLRDDTIWLLHNPLPQKLEIRVEFLRITE